MSYETAEQAQQTDAARSTALVLADAGSDMWIVRARFPEPPDVGSRFTFQEIEWRLVWRCERGFGAHPDLN